MVACFAAKTPILCAGGSQFVEDIRENDLVWSRDEHNSNGPVELKRVEEVFTRLGRILHLHIHDRVIRTTPEHPFYVRERGWIPAGQLRINDQIASHNGQWHSVDDLFDTGEWEAVYNFRVADFHTYFVGNEQWGFSVWAHNADCTAFDVRSAAQKAGLNPIVSGGRVNQLQRAVNEANASGDWNGVKSILNTHYKGQSLSKRADMLRNLMDNTNDAVIAARNAAATAPVGNHLARYGRLTPYDPNVHGLTGKPPHSPIPEKWINDQGRIHIGEDGTWIYTHADGVSVAYPGGSPDFGSVPGLVKAEAIVPGGYAGNRLDSGDYGTFEAISGRQRVRGLETWHHVEDGIRGQLLDLKYHRAFTHLGGIGGI
jgi:hypothetical protein